MRAGGGKLRYLFVAKKIMADTKIIWRKGYKVKVKTKGLSENMLSLIDDNDSKGISELFFSYKLLQLFILLKIYLYDYLQ